MDKKYQIWLARDEKWKDIFSSFNEDFHYWKNDFLKEYLDMKKEQYDRIEDCVNTAMEKGNHLAFVHYFLDECKYEHELFAKELEKYIGRMDRNFGTSNNSMYILKGDTFLDSEVILPEENPKIEKGFYNSNTLRSWKLGEGLPNNRYAIIQMGIYFRLNSETVNGLLSLAGMQKLYPVNGVDFICSVYLDYYFNEDFKKLKSRHPKRKTGLKKIQFKKISLNNDEGYQRLRKVKEQVNEFLKDHLVFIGKGESLESTQFMQIKSKKLVLPTPLTENIEEDVSTIKDRIGEREGVPEDDIKTKFITDFFLKKRKQLKTEEEIIEFLEKKEEYLDVFSIKYYELQRKLLQFVKDENAYKKNNSDVFNEKQGRITESTLLSLQDENLREEDAVLYDEKKKSEKGKKKKQSDKVREQIESLKKIWNHGETATSGSFTKLEQLIFGRELRAEKVGSSPSASGSKGKYYTVDIKRYDLIKFCIAAGKENELSKMLDLAEFRGYEEIQNEKSDALLAYLYQYREHLIDKIVGSDVMKKEKLRKRFPFISLCIELNRELQFILEYLYGTYLAEKEYDEKVGYYNRLEEEMIKKKKKRNARLRQEEKKPTLGSLEKWGEEKKKINREIENGENELKKKSRILKELTSKRRYESKNGQRWRGMSLQEWRNLKMILLYPINL